MIEIMTIPHPSSILQDMEVLMPIGADIRDSSLAERDLLTFRRWQMLRPHRSFWYQERSVSREGQRQGRASKSLRFLAGNSRQRLWLREVSIDNKGRKAEGRNQVTFTATWKSGGETR